MVAIKADLNRWVGIVKPIIFVASSMDLILEQPTWFLLLCLCLGVVYSTLLYRKSLRKDRQNKPFIQWVLAVLRTVVVSALAILVLNPLLKYVETTLEKPVVFVYTDQSQSMVLGGDSAYAVNQLPGDVDQLEKTLTDKFDVIRIDPSAQEQTYSKTNTDLSAPFREIRRLYDTRNVAGLVMVSDGIYNVGVNPSFETQKSNFPIYTVPVGDSTIYQDVSVYNAKANAVTFLGNMFPIEVVVNADKANGQSVELSIWQNGIKLDKKVIVVKGNRFTISHTFFLEAKATGSQVYTVSVSGLPEELNVGNNARLVYTDVLDVKQRILVAAHAPHPDVALLRKVISSNDQYELDVQIGFFDKLEANKYDLVITHQLPVNAYESNLMQSVKELKMPLLYILGTQTNMGLLNRLDLGIEINGNRRNFNQGLAKVNADFALFDLDDGLKQFMQNAPPLTIPFGEFKIPVTANVLAYQRIGSVETSMPLLSFTNNSGYRVGVCSGEGLWRWQYQDYEQNESFENIQQLIRKSIQYLALKDDKRKFKVYTSGKSYFENDKISFTGEVYNDSYEFTEEANVELTLSHVDGTQYTYTLVPQQGAYRYSVGALPVGSYSFNATAQYNGELFKESGSFVVKAVQVESQTLTANYGLMRQMAKESGGAYYSKEEWSDLAEVLMALPNASSVVKENSRYRDLISQKWLFFLIVGLLCVEWFARRWLGGY